MNSQTLTMKPASEEGVQEPQQLLMDWLRRYLGDILSLEPEQVDLDTTFSRFGLDSSAALGLIGDLSKWLGTNIDEATPYDYPTIRQLTSALLTEPATLRAVCAKL